MITETLITKTLARFAATTPNADLPPEVTARALDLFCDLIGSVLRASTQPETTASLLAMIESLGLSGDESCTVFGLDRRFGAAAAALLNGTLGHALDFDDTHADSSLHPSAPVIPAALAAAERSQASGPALLASIVIGFETAIRVGLALDPTAHYARGFHPTATAGIFGAAAAAGRLFHLNPRQMASAFGVAASQASGSLQFLENGAWNKRYQVGEAAMKGLIAADLARAGFLGADQALEGRHGFLAAYSDAPRPEQAIADLGQVWQTLRIGVKPYPACRYTHAAVDGILRLLGENGWQAAQVEAIRIGLHRNGIALVGAPLAAKQRARSIVEGQFSMPFAAAVALLRKGFGWDDYALLGRPETDAIAAKVDVIHDPSLEGLPHPFGATLEMRVAGQSHKLRIPDPSGEPTSFPDAAQSRAKFVALAGPVLRQPAEAWLETLQGIGRAEDVSRFLRGLGR